MWNKERLQEAIRNQMGDYRLVVVSNRQPYGHVLKSGKIIAQRQSGGLVTALDPVMQAAQGIWVAAGTSTHDRFVLDENQKVKLPTEKPSYEL